jgi:DNA-binding MarR family transcriptional regulator
MNDEKENSVKKNFPREAIDNLLQAGNWTYEKETEHLKQYALSLEQHKVLVLLRERRDEVINMSTIQEGMISEMSNATRLVEKLRVKGYLTRAQSKENRRKVEIRITDKGMLLLVDIDKTQKKHEKAMVKNLTRREIESLSRILLKIQS